jgi:NAD(P)-dependent dehydrogenase (short-subunit alcohol dehydrogenase family)
MGHRSNSKVVVVTGASAGVGRAAALRFARGGYDVALIARGRAGLEAAAQEVRSFGSRALVLPADVTDRDAIDAAAEQTERELGEIDVWVNVAFSSVFASFVDTDPDDFERATNVSYMGFVNGTRAALRYMKPRDHGAIVQVGSALSYRAIPLQSVYCGAKFAIRGFTDSVRCELLHDKSHVRISMVQLPAHNTPQFDWVRSKLPRRPQPVPPIYQPEVAADAVFWAAKHYRREWFVTFSALRAVMANKFFPGALDHYLGWKGVESQETDERSGERAGNLYEPLDAVEDRGTHGRFGDKARPTGDLQWKATKHRRAVLGTVIGLTGVALPAVRKTLARH